MGKRIDYVAISDNKGNPEILPIYVKISRDGREDRAGYYTSENSASRLLKILTRRGAPPDVCLVDGTLWVYYWSVPQADAD